MYDAGLGEVSSRMDVVLSVPAGLSDMLQNGELYGKLRIYPERARNDRDFSEVLQCYCRRSARVSRSTSGRGCPVQLFIEKHRRFRGWKMTWKGVHNHTRVVLSEKPLRYKNLIARMTELEERAQSGLWMDREGGTAVGNPVMHATDGGQAVADHDMVGDGKRKEGADKRGYVDDVGGHEGSIGGGICSFAGEEGVTVEILRVCQGGEP